MTQLKRDNFLDSMDEISMTTSNPPSFNIITRLRQFDSNDSMYNAESFNALLLNQEAANLFGLPDAVSLSQDNTYREWRKAEMDTWYKDDADLWISISSFSQTDREEVKRYLPNPRSYAYRDLNHFLTEFVKAITDAVGHAKSTGKFKQNDNVTCFVSSGRPVIYITTMLNTLPGRDISDTARLNGLSFSPALAYLLGIGNARSNQPVRLIARNYYLDYQGSGYTRDEFRSDSLVADPGSYWNLGVSVMGKYSIHLKYVYGLGQNNPANMRAASVSVTRIHFTRTGPVIDLSKKTLKYYVEKNLAGKGFSVGNFITKQNDIDIKETGHKHQSVATTNFSLKSEIKIKTGHSVLNIYSDIVDPQVVGDEMKNLLRSVSHNRSSTQQGSLTEINLVNPCYVPLKPGLREIREIPIKIEDEHDHGMPFAPGKTSMDLHFRPTKRRKLSQFNVSVPCGENVLLPTAYDISPEWEVCLMDLRFPFRWKHVLGCEMKATLSVGRETAKEVCVPPGEYTTQDFLAQLDAGIQKASSHNIKLLKTGTKYHNPVVIEVNSDPYNSGEANSIQLSDDLAQTLGLFESATLTDVWRAGTGNQSSPNWQTIPSTEPKPQFTAVYTRRANRGAIIDLVTRSSSTSGAYRKTKFTFKDPVDLNRGFRLFRVYAHHLIQPVHIGGVKASMLREFIPETKDKKNGEIVYQQFLTPHYKAVEPGISTLKNINISIADELGRPIQFTGNIKPYITLHFRRE